MLPERCTSTSPDGFACQLLPKHSGRHWARIGSKQLEWGADDATWIIVAVVAGLILSTVLCLLVGCKTACQPECCAACAPQIVTVPAPPCVNVTPLPPPMPVPVEPAIKSSDPGLTTEGWLSAVVTDLEYWVRAFRECSLEIQANNGARPAEPTPRPAPKPGG